MMYLVKYQGGEWEDYFENEIFVTESEETAQKYVEKFNRVLNKWKEYYKQFEEFDGLIMWIKEEYVEKHFDRWNQINEIKNAFYEKVEVR